MELSNALRGREVAAVICNGHIVVIKCHDGREIRVAWLDENGETVKGTPVLEGHGFRLRAEGIRELIELPHSARA
jgi:hypothetical protein